MLSNFIETQIILWFRWYFALFDPQQTICLLFLCLKIYQKWSSIWSSLGNWQKGVLETSRGWQCPNGDVLGQFGAPSWNQEGPNIDPWSDQNRPRDAQREVPRMSRGVLRRFKTCVDALRWILKILKWFWTILRRFKTNIDDFQTILRLNLTILRPWPGGVRGAIE